MTRNRRAASDNLKPGSNPDQPQTEQPPKKNPDLVRAVSANQAASAREWIRLVRSLEDFREGRWFNCPIDNRNLDPGSSIPNITQGFGNLPGFLHENVDYEVAKARLDLKMTAVETTLTGTGSNGMNLYDALLNIITAQAELQAQEKITMRATLAQYIANIQAQAVQVRATWAAEVHMIERAALVPPNVLEVDL